MTDRTYTQAEADALIAGAVLAAAALTPECGNGYACKTMNAKYSTYCPNCKTRNAILALNSDAARLALERENAKDAEIARLMAEVAIKIESFRAMAASEFELRQKVVAFEEREMAIRVLLLEGFNIVSSAYAHVSHGGPTREEALAWIKKVEKQLEGQIVIDPEIRDLKVEWVKLPGAMPGMRHLHIATTHGDNSVREFWLTEKQAQAVGQFACAAREAKLIADTREAEFDRVLDFLDESIDEDAGMDHWAARAYQAVATLRAAVQPGG